MSACTLCWPIHPVVLTFTLILETVQDVHDLAKIIIILPRVNSRRPRRILQSLL